MAESSRSSKRPGDKQVRAHLLYRDVGPGASGGHVLIALEFEGGDVVEAEAFTHHGEDGVTRAYVRLPIGKFLDIGTKLDQNKYNPDLD